MGTPPATVLGMSLRRLALLALVAAAVVPAVAGAAVPVSLYPVRVPGLSPAERADLHAFLKAALASGVRRGVLRPRPPHLLAPTCGELPVAPACLGRLARDGVILAGHGERRNGIVLLSAALYDRNGARTREVRFVVDLVIENLRPVNDALTELESELDDDGTVAGAPKPPPVPPETLAAKRFGGIPRPAVKTPPPAPVAVAPKPGEAAPPKSLHAFEVPLPPPPTLRPPKPATATAAGPAAPTSTPAKTTAAVTAPAKAAPAPIDVSAPVERPLWKRQAGPFFTIVGGALLASGAAVAVANRSLTHDLDTKRAAGTLTAADRTSYDKVDRYNVLSTVLLAGGGVSAVAGTYLWITAPARPGDPALAALGGRF